MLRKFLAFITFAIILSWQTVIAQDVQKEENKKLQLTPYGFVKGDMFYVTDGVYSFANPNNDYILAPQFASGSGQSAISFTGQHTRFGLKSTVGNKVKVGGLVEIDFFGGPADANTKIRLRQGYASIATGGFEARFGQQWDLFSPNIPNTVNTNGNMWYNGNMGFRRGQIQLSYKWNLEKINPMLQIAFAEGAQESIGLGKDNISGQPMIQARLSGKFDDKYTVGVYYVNAAFKEKYTPAIPPNDHFKFNTTGFGVDFNLPFDKYFSLVGEINSGTNLANANIFSAAGNFFYFGTSDQTRIDFDRKNTGFWLNASSNVSEMFQVVLGYGMDKNTSKKFITGNIQSNSTFYADLIFPIKHQFSITLEIGNISTKIVESINNDHKVDKTKTNNATVIALSGKVAF
jgi:hypothetical protein